MAQDKITGNSVLFDILKRPGAEEVLRKYGLPCLSCPMAAHEIGALKIGEVSEKYGMDTEGLLDDLNGLEENKEE